MTEQPNTDVQATEIDIISLLIGLRRKWYIMILFVVLCAVIGYFAYNITQVESYETNASLVINSKQATIIDGELVYVNNIYLSQEMVNTYSIILKSDRVLEKVKADLGLYETVDEIRSYIDVTSAKDSEVLFISVDSPDPRLSMEIANTIMAEAPEAISKTVEVGSINVLDYAKLPYEPVYHNNYMGLAIGGAIGLLLGGLLILALMVLSPKVQDSEEISTKLLLNPLGEIPHVKKGRTYDLKAERLHFTELDNFQYEEAYRSLNVAVNHLKEHKNLKTLLVTSALDMEGKTTVAMNLALACAKGGRKVCLVDADLRKPRLTELTGRHVSQYRDILSVLKGESPVDMCIQNDEETGVSYLLCKDRVPDAATYMGSDGMKALVGELSSMFDCVIFDTPPSYYMADAVALSSFVDGVLMVIKQDHAKISVVADTRNNFQKVGAYIIGSVINDVRFHTRGSSYKYKYMNKKYYEYGYGYSKSGDKNSGEKKKSVKTYGYSRSRKKMNKGRFFTGLVFMIAVIAGIIWFANTSAVDVTKMAESTAEDLVMAMEGIGVISPVPRDVQDKIVAIATYKDLVDEINDVMQYAIHAVMFFILSLIALNTLKQLKIRKILVYLLTVLICVVLSVGNEVFHDMFTDGRAMETIDVIMGMAGMAAGFIVFFLFAGIRRLFKGKRKKPMIVVSKIAESE